MTTSKYEKLGTAEVQVWDLGGNKELHTFKNPSTNDYWITLSTDELTSRCPATNHPDFATLTIKYMPEERCVEMKSLKLYIESFRDEGHFYEELINLIYGHLLKVLDPQELEVVGDFHVRGGMPAQVRVELDHQLIYDDVEDSLNGA